MVLRDGGGAGSVRVVVRLNDFKGLFPPDRFCDSVNFSRLYSNNFTRYTLISFIKWNCSSIGNVFAYHLHIVHIRAAVFARTVPVLGSGMIWAYPLCHQWAMTQSFVMALNYHTNSYHFDFFMVCSEYRACENYTSVCSNILSEIMSCHTFLFCTVRRMYRWQVL